MDVYSNLAIFYQTSPHFGEKWTSCVAILAQNTWVCGRKPVIYYYKVNISLLGRFMKPGLATKDRFLVQSCHFLPVRSPFWRKTGKFCCCFGSKHTCAWVQSGTVPFELQYQFIVNVCEACDWNHRCISTPSPSLSFKPVPILEKNRLQLDWMSGVVTGQQKNRQ